MRKTILWVTLTGISQLTLAERYDERFADYSKSANCVIDKRSGLMWQKSPSKQVYDWHQAKAVGNYYSLCGYNDWRLPQSTELFEIIKYARMQSYSTPAMWLNSHFFDNLSNEGAYWSASKADDTRAFIYSLGTGYLSNSSFFKDKHYIWLCRTME